MGYTHTPSKSRCVSKEPNISPKYIQQFPYGKKTVLAKLRAVGIT